MSVCQRNQGQSEGKPDVPGDDPKYDIIIGREKRHVALFEDKYRKAGGELTEEMIVNKEFYEM